MNEYQLGGLFRIFVLLLSLPIVVFGVFAAVEGDAYYRVVCVATVVAYGIAILPVLLKPHYDVFEPYTVLLLAIIIGVVLRTWYVVLTGQEELRDFLLLGYPPSILVPGALVAVLGCGGLALGYMQGRATTTLARQRLFLTNAWSPQRQALFVGICIVVGIVSFVAFVREFQASLALQQLGDLSSKRYGKVEGSAYRTAFGYARWGVSLLGVAFMVLLISATAQRRKPSALVLAGLIVSGTLSLAFPIFTSSRMEFMTQIGTLFAAYLYVRGRIPVRAVVGIPLATIILFMAVTGLRTKISDSRELVEYLTQVPLAEETVGSRFFIDIVRTSLIMQHYPEQMPHKLGLSFLSPLTAPVPRTLWPDKPSIGLGKEVGWEVYHYRSAGVPPGFLGELWINFGWWLIAPGMWLYGYVLRAYYEAFRPVLHLRNGAISYAALLLPLAYTMQADFSIGFVDVMTTSLPVLAGIIFMTRKPPFAVSERGLAQGGSGT